MLKLFDTVLTIAAGLAVVCVISTAFEENRRTVRPVPMRLRWPPRTLSEFTYWRPYAANYLSN